MLALVTVDKPYYQLGEDVHVQAVAVDAFSLKAVPNLSLQCYVEIHGPSVSKIPAVSRIVISNEFFYHSYG